MGAGTAQKIEWVRAAAGSRFPELEFNTYPSLNPVTITGQPGKVAHEIAGRLKQRFDVELTESDILDSPHVFVGSIDSMVEKCLGLRERFGISYIFIGNEFREFAPVVERLAGH